MSTRVLRGAAIAAAALSLSATLSLAGFTGTQRVITITATTAGGRTASWSSAPMATDALFGSSDRFTWGPSWSGGQASYGDGQGTLFTVFNNATEGATGVGYVEDPQVSVFFAVQAEESDTTFTISSAVLGFPTELYSLSGSAQMGVTDTNGNGASIVGADSAGAFRYYLNNSIVGTLIPGVSTPSGSANPPASLITTPAQAVASNMQAEFSFTLSAGDLATGSATFITTLVPAPGAAALLGLGGLVAARRRRN